MRLGKRGFQAFATEEVVWVENLLTRVPNAWLGWRQVEVCLEMFWVGFPGPWLRTLGVELLRCLLLSAGQLSLPFTHTTLWP